MKNVYNIIDESPFYFTLKGIEFYFSSEFNLRRFKERYKNYIKEENAKINHRYNINIELFYPLLLSLYKKIEKRGFKIYDTNLDLLLINEIKFSTIIS